MGANSTTALAGHLGKAVVDDKLVLRLTEWTHNPVSSTTKWGDSDSGGFTNSKIARKDSSGTIGAKFDTGKKPYTVLKAGDSLKLVLWYDAILYWAYPCVSITGYSETVNPDTKEVVAWSATWEADGIYYYPGEAGAPVETLPAA